MRLKMGHFHKLLCEEMIFPRQWKYTHTKVCGNAIPIIRGF